MHRKPIYVETDIATSMDILWKHTQHPELHEQWDLRFSEITYLPRQDHNLPQQFLYRTRIGFGIDIAGTGTTKSTSSNHKTTRMSTLSFGSDQAISLIREGGGYWKYDAKGEKIVFKTRFDYKTRFGLLGSWLDKLLFRPLFGYATAWSFDVLKIWLEKGLQPAAIIQNAVIHYFSVLMISFLWIYQGLVPKVLFPTGGEIEIMSSVGFTGWENQILLILGSCEIFMGLLTLYWHDKRWLYKGQIVVLTLLALFALIGSPELLKAPFNPFTLSGTMIVLCLIASWTTKNLPKAGRCIRKNSLRISEEGGRKNDIHL